jgi:hypothetical protein
MRRAMLVAGLAFACIQARAFVSQASPREATPEVHSVASDSERASVAIFAFEEESGRFLGPPTVVAFESEDHKNLAARFLSGTGEGIPYGVYRLEAGLVAHITAVRYVLVNRPRVSFVVGLPVSPIESIPYPSIQGRISGGSPLKHTFIRLLGTYSGQVLESAVGQDGTFGFPSVRCCKYLLLIIGDGSAVASKDITISDETLSRSIRVSIGTPPLEIEIERVTGNDQGRR